MLGVAPIVAAIRFHKISDKVATSLLGVWSAILLAGLALLGMVRRPPCLRLAESSFWSLNSLAVQPCYTACREALRHLVRRRSPDAAGGRRHVLHAAAAIVSGPADLRRVAADPVARLAVHAICRPHRDPQRAASTLPRVALANSAVLVSGLSGGRVAGLGHRRREHGAAARPAGVRRGCPTARSVARRAPLGHPRRRRALRLPHRERPRRPARQRAACAQVLAQLATIHARRAARSRPDHRRHDRRRPLRRVGRVPRRPRAAIRNSPKRTLDPAGQPRRQHRRSGQSGAARTADEPGQAAAADADAVRAWRRCRASARASSTGAADGSGDAVAASAGAASRGASRRSPTPARRGCRAVLRPVGRTSFRWCCRRTARTASASSCSTRMPSTHFSFTNALGLVPEEDIRAPRRSSPAVSAGALDRRAASPSGRVSAAGQGVLGAHRHGADQRQLVRAPAAAARRTASSLHARPPPRRLDRRMRPAADRLGAVAGDGGDERRADQLLHPHLGGRRRRRLALLEPERIDLAGVGCRVATLRPVLRVGFSGASIAPESRSATHRLEVMLRAEGEDGDDDRHADEGARRCPTGTSRRTPRTGRGTARSQRRAGEARLDIAADHELDEVQADEDRRSPTARTRTAPSRTRSGSTVATSGPRNGM